jgi:hypothetical protein
VKLSRQNSVHAAKVWGIATSIEHADFVVGVHLFFIERFQVALRATAPGPHPPSWQQISRLVFFHQNRLAFANFLPEHRRLAAQICQ